MALTLRSLLSDDRPEVFVTLCTNDTTALIRPALGDFERRLDLLPSIRPARFGDVLKPSSPGLASREMSVSWDRLSLVAPVTFRGVVLTGIDANGVAVPIGYGNLPRPLQITPQASGVRLRVRLALAQGALGAGSRLHVAAEAFVLYRGA